MVHKALPITPTGKLEKKTPEKGQLVATLTEDDLDLIWLLKNYGTLFHCELSSDPKTSTLKLSRSDLNIFQTDLDELSCPDCHLIHCFLFLSNIHIYVMQKPKRE